MRGIESAESQCASLPYHYYPESGLVTNKEPYKGMELEDFTDNIVCSIVENKHSLGNGMLIAKACNSYGPMLEACKNALADMEGIMPEHEPSGDRLHSGWRTIYELKEAIRIAENEEYRKSIYKLANLIK